jgi:Cd2+/Zn2+-exporting ATPase
MSVFAAKSCSCGCQNDNAGSTPEKNQGNSPENSPGNEHGARREIILLTASGLIFALTLFFQTKIEAAFGLWAVRLSYAIPYLLCGIGIFRQAFEEMKKGIFFNEFSLMSIATIAAIGLGELAEAVGVMLFYRIGEFFQERAATGSRKSIASLLASKPTLARLVTVDRIWEAPVEEAAVGDIFEVRAGEKVPLDGLIVSGESQADQSPLTGESLPVTLSPGSAVLAGSINLSGTLRARVSSRYTDSHMARILDMVENASQRKSPTERFISRFARWYTPAVVTLAALTATLPPLILPGASFSDWLYRALILLIISCPCALLISIPLSYFAGIGAASRAGALVKGGNVLDDLLRVEAVVFDKTGTLTESKFTVAGLYPAPTVDEKGLLRAAFIAERHGSHPIAQAICRHAEEYQPEAEPNLVPDSDEYPGKGMAARHGGERFLAGTKTFLEENGVVVGDAAASEQPGALVYIARDQQFLGLILVTDTIRVEARRVVADLKKEGFAISMLTGDHEKPAAWVAKECGIDTFRAGLLPETKVAALQDIFPADAATTRVAFVGDGINDAPILVMARVGIAMGSVGSAAAIEAADAVIIGDSLTKVAKLFKLAKDVRTNVYQNIAMALGVKAGVLVLGLAGLSGLWEAVFADVGVALLAVLNASRLMRE